jgi:Na+-translocating ferredoxin:NAD+ oxidoreductase subunit C
MMKRSFFGIVKPKLEYDVIDDIKGEPLVVSPQDSLILFIDQAYEKFSEAVLHVGDSVKRGQKLVLTEGGKRYALAGRAGRISGISPFIGLYGRQMTAVEIKINEGGLQEDDPDFKNSSSPPTLKSAREFLEGIPGKPDFEVFGDADKPIRAILVIGADADLFGVTNQYFVKNNIISIKTGIDILRKITGVLDVVLVVPPHLVNTAGTSGAVVKTVDSRYPAAHPRLIVRHFREETAGDRKSGDRKSNFAVFTAESVAALGAAYNTGRLPLEKLLLFVSRDGSKRLASVVIGTPLKDVLNAFGETLNERDRVIFGGPMTGVSVYSDMHPISADTDTIIVQDRDQVMELEDTPCINCGECVRVCPTNVPVNLLIRFLEAGQYEEAARQYDLHACIDCGFCSYVCESRIPILQHIALAKHTLDRMEEAEVNHA